MVGKARRYLTVILLAGALAGVAVLVAVLGHSRSRLGPALPAGRAVVATASISPRAPLFGDTVTARVEVLADRRLVLPDTLRLEPDFRPYQLVGAVERTREDVGETSRLRFEFRLSCLTADCPPARSFRQFAFPRAVIVYFGRGRRTVDGVEWPEFEVASRLSARDLTRPALRGDLSLPSVSYRLRPETLAAGLLAGAALLILAAGGGLAYALRRPAPSPAPERGEVSQASPLERALALVRAAVENGESSEKRKALERLARELGRSGRTALAARARRLAWSERDPPRSAIDGLSAGVRRAIAEGSDDGAP